MGLSYDRNKNIVHIVYKFLTETWCSPPPGFLNLWLPIVSSLLKGPAAGHPITINKILITQEWVKGVTQKIFFKSGSV